MKAKQSREMYQEMTVLKSFDRGLEMMGAKLAVAARVGVVEAEGGEEVVAEVALQIANAHSCLTEDESNQLQCYVLTQDVFKPNIQWELYKIALNTSFDFGYQLLQFFSRQTQNPRRFEDTRRLAES